MASPGYSTSCERVRAERAAQILGLGRTWGKYRSETMRKTRALPTYDAQSDTVIICMAFLPPPVILEPR